MNATKLLIALLAYQQENGSLPASLDQLVPTYILEIPKDPYDNLPYKYSAANKVIYSVGKDKKVDDGKADIHSQGVPDYYTYYS